MRQLTNRQTNPVGARRSNSPARYSLGEVEDLDHNRKKRKAKTGDKITGNDETFSIPYRGSLSSEKRETGNVSRRISDRQ